MKVSAMRDSPQFSNLSTVLANINMHCNCVMAEKKGVLFFISCLAK